MHVMTDNVVAPSGECLRR